MSKQKLYRLISLIMLIVAMIFVVAALSNPALGSTVRIGSLTIGADVWRKFYILYLAVMAFLFAKSFRCK